MKTLPFVQVGSLPKVGQERFGGVPQMSPVAVGQEKPEMSPRALQVAAETGGDNRTREPTEAVINTASALNLSINKAIFGQNKISPIIAGKTRSV